MTGIIFHSFDVIVPNGHFPGHIGYKYNFAIRNCKSDSRLFSAVLVISNPGPAECKNIPAYNQRLAITGLSLLPACYGYFIVGIALYVSVNGNRQAIAH
ncbi:hypothetical protein [Mucilaginibacter ginsenosidivorax]|uniref:Uncharacterized protein n=1 Tax=Mucilaginibacter ginsenosidivorax TaxID=862126 RepID=A0A5B8W816_9SPHI|nr:hypothetical protein [Mucilaginibacter ginsenosidivorax]QEC79831.1 hypothetical protein FSB76_29165 [Mucilaginibacter ginsenosidivorax]